MNRQKITPEIVATVKGMVDAGKKSYSAIARSTKISHSTVQRIATGQHSLQRNQGVPAPQLMQTTTPMQKPSGLTKGQKAAVTRRENRIAAEKAAAAEVNATVPVQINGVTVLLPKVKMPALHALIFG